jgi:hypothetical protein
VRLAEGEEVLLSVVATHAGPGWFDRQGTLAVTTKRLIHVPLRWPLTPIGSRPFVVSLSDVRGCQTKRKPEPDKPSSFVVKAVVVETNGGRRETFWPASEPDAVVREVLRGAGNLKG